VPVVVLAELHRALATAAALQEGGLDVMEITLRTPAGLASIRAVSSTCPDILVGAGTVVTEEQGKACVEAGARFIVSPGFNCRLVEWCVNNHIPIIPGCVTPTEIMQALERGVRIVKFFPAQVFGGLPAMKALAAPFGEVKFIPTGGVNAHNLCDYIRAPFIHAVGGSWLCDQGDIRAGNFEQIRSLSAEAVQIVQSCRTGSRRQE
jgi:2-dehydro-3-deoxyphosphogluconate aldolase/(4S)-4-hydroxy-2-oxoglutarate aldolase